MSTSDWTFFLRFPPPGFRTAPVGSRQHDQHHLHQVLRCFADFPGFFWWSFVENSTPHSSSWIHLKLGISAAPLGSSVSFNMATVLLSSRPSARRVSQALQPGPRAKKKCGRLMQGNTPNLHIFIYIYSYWKSPFSLGKSTISMGHYPKLCNKLPEAHIKHPLRNHGLNGLVGNFHIFLGPFMACSMGISGS